MTQDEFTRLIVILEAADRIAKAEDQGTAYGAAAQALQAQQAEIRDLRLQIVQCGSALRHTSVFIRSREKMHPDGLRMHDELVAALEPLQ